MNLKLIWFKFNIPRCRRWWSILNFYIKAYDRNYYLNYRNNISAFRFVLDIVRKIILNMRIKNSGLV